MRLSLRKPAQQLFRTTGMPYIRADLFAVWQHAATKLISRVDEDETEEFQRRIVTGFMQEIMPEAGWLPDVNPYGVLLLTKSGIPDHPPVMLVVKRAYGAEMMTPLKPNVKALHALILSCFDYLEQTAQLPEILVVTDGFSWFWFDSSDVHHYFIDHPRLRRAYQLKQQGKSETLVYGEMAKTIRELQADVPVTYVNLRGLVGQPADTVDWVEAALLFRGMDTGASPEAVIDPALMAALTDIREIIPDSFTTWFCWLLFLRALECKIRTIGGEAPTAIGDVQTNEDLAAILTYWSRTHPGLLTVDAAEWESVAVTIPDGTGSGTVLVALARLLAGCDLLLSGPPQVIAEGRFILTAAGIDALMQWLAGEDDAPWALSRQAVRVAVEQTVTQKLNDRFGWNTENVTQLQQQLESVPVAEGVAVYREIAVCDPYTRSGRLLQLTLQELVQIQHTLGLLTDSGGRSLQQYRLTAGTYALQLTTTDEEPVYYQLPESVDRNTEPQRVQKALFEAKKALLTSALYGVAGDTQQRTIVLTRLSLELLTDVYAVADKKKGIAWPVFPELRWQLQHGNGLFYQLDLKLPFWYTEDELANRLKDLAEQLQRYREKESRTTGQLIRQQLGVLRGHLQTQLALADRPLQDRLIRLQAIYTQRYEGNLLFPEQLNPSQQADQEKLRLEIARLTRRLEERQNDNDPAGIEWRIDWPSRLADDGSFKGFDAIISQPPILVPDMPENRLSAFKSQFKAVYTAKAPAFVYYLRLGIALLPDGRNAWFLLPEGWEKKTGTKKAQRWLEDEISHVTIHVDETVDVLRITKTPVKPAEDESDSQ